MDLDAICSTLKLDPFARGLQILDAAHLARSHFPPLDPNLPALITRLDSRDLATRCQRALLLVYPREHPVTRVDATGKKASQGLGLDEIKGLSDLARGDGFAPETFLYIPPLAPPASFNALANIVTHLRAPEGCPWDCEQTHKSLRQYLLEECYEVLETIDRGDTAHLREELGDLLSLILLQIQIAYEANEFSLSDVIAEISDKLVRRHPHVFGDVKLNGMDELLANWERIKSEERGSETSHASRIPRALPALMRAQKIASRQKKQLRAKELEAQVERLPRARNKEKALGKVLFTLAAYAERNGIDSESALRAVAAEK